MRIAIAQLRKMKLPYSYEEELDLKEELDGFEDIIESSICKIRGVISSISLDRYLVKMDISIDLTIESAISLKPIIKNISFSCEEIYDRDSQEDEDINLIVGQTLDTKEAIITQILCNKPMRTIGEDEIFEDDNIIEDLEEDDINPAFASLRDFLK